MFTNRGFMPFFAIMLGMFMFMSSAFADGNVGVSFNQIGDDVSWGGDVEIPFKVTDTIGGEVDLTLQGGEQIRARYHGEVSFEAYLKWKLFADGYGKGATFSTMGRTTDFGVGTEADVGPLTVEIGVFQRTANAIGSPNAFDQLDALGYDPNVLEELGLQDLHPAPTGLSIKSDNSFGLRLRTEFSIGALDFDVTGMPEISNSDNKVHQLITGISTSWEIYKGVRLGGTLEIGLQTFDGEIQKEAATFFTVNVDL